MTCWASLWIDRWWPLDPREVCSRLLSAPCQNDSPSRWPNLEHKGSKPSGLGSFLREAPCALPGIATPCIYPDRLCSPSCQLLEISQDKHPLGTASSSVPSETHHLGESKLWQGWLVAVWTRFYPLCSRCIVSQPNNLHLERATLQPELNPGVTVARLAQEQGLSLTS